MKNDTAAKQGDFTEILKNAYECGSKDNGVTVVNLVEQLKTDLKKMMLSNIY